MIEAFIFHSELAESPKLVRFIPDTEIEVTHPLPAYLATKHCIFDHDGTLSVLRQG